MAKSKRIPRAQNKIQGSQDGDLIKVEPEPFPHTAAEVRRDVTVSRSRYFNAEFEALIELLAIDRVYRAMRDRVGRHLRIGTMEAPPPEPPLLRE